MNIEERIERRLSDFVERETIKKIEAEKEFYRMTETRREQERIRREQIFPNLIPATVKDYISWLKGFMENGGEPTDLYDYEMSDDFYIAKSNFRMMPLYGAKSIQIVVPEKISVFHEHGEDVGHCNLYFMAGFELIGSSVPVFLNTRF